MQKCRIVFSSMFCALCLAIQAPAQTYVDASYQLISLSSGGTLTIAPAVPSTGDMTILRLEQHSSLGAVLGRVQHYHGGLLRRTFKGDPGNLGNDSGLWSVRVGTVPDAANPSMVVSELGPTANMKLYSLGGATGTTQSAVLQWSQVPLPGANESIDVELELSVGYRISEPLITAEILCRRNPANPPSYPHYSLEAVDIQVTLTEAKTAAGNARAYIPINDAAQFAVNNIAIPYLGISGSEAYVWNHPGYHSMQFAGFFQPGHASSVFLGTEDYRGYRKFFRYHATRAPQSQEYSLAWRARYVPEHDRSPWDDAFLAPYPVLIHSLRDRSSAWWYDVADFYRRLIQAGPDNLNNIVKAALGSPGSHINPVVAGNCVYQLSSQAGASNGVIFGQQLDQARAIQKLLNPGNPSSVPAFVQVQEWFNGVTGAPIGPDVMPQYPVAGPGPYQAHVSLRAAMAQARQDGIAVILYTKPDNYRLNAGWTALLPPPSNLALWARDNPFGSKDIVRQDLYGEFQFKMDMATPSLVPLWFAIAEVREIWSALPDLRGLYLDAIAGAGPPARYREINGFPQATAPFHGGYVSQNGRIELFDLTRLRLQQLIPTSGNPTHPDIPVLAGEIAEEYLAGHMDITQRGLHLYPGQGMLGELSSGSNQLNWQAQDLLPPTWNLVCHETAPTYAIGMQPTLVGLNLLGEDDYLNEFAYVHGLMFVNGMNPPFFSSRSGNSHDLQLFDHQTASGFGTRVLTETQTKVAGAVRDMIRAFHIARKPQYAGVFLCRGRRERPLVVNHGGPVIGQEENPHAYSPMTKVWDRIAGNSSIQPGIEILPFTSQFVLETLKKAGNWPFGIGDSPVVYHSVWSHSSQPKKLVLVFWNWSDNSARWQGSFDPALYDIPNAYKLKVIDPVSGLSGFEHNLSGTKVLVWNVRTGTQVGLSAKNNHPDGNLLPSRSPRIVEISWQ